MNKKYLEQFDKLMVFGDKAITKFYKAEPKEKQLSKYQRECKGATIDVYDMLMAFNVTNPATAHAIKKLLAAGQRGYKDVEQDLNEAIASIQRAIELEKEKQCLQK